MTWKEKKQERMAKSAAMDVAVARHKKNKNRVNQIEVRRSNFDQHSQTNMPSSAIPKSSLSPPLRSFSSSTASSAGSMPVRHFPKEVDGKGNVEYKLRLIHLTSDRVEQLRTQMKWRVEEGRGEALYRIGVMDDGEPVGLTREDLKKSLDMLAFIAKPLGFETSVVEITDGTFEGRKCAAVLVRHSAEQLAARQATMQKVDEEVRVAIVGAFGSGKSSIAAYLVRGIADDGCGKAGRCVAVHKHEIQHGRTSSFSSHALPPLTPQSRSKNLTRTGLSKTDSASSSWSQRAFMGCTEGVVMRGVENIFSDLELHHHEHSDDTAMVPSKVVSLLDAGGHPKALTSCFRGLCASKPDYYMLCLDVETAAGQHPDRLQIALDFWRVAVESQIPYFLVITKSDKPGLEANEDLLQSLFCSGNKVLALYTSDNQDEFNHSTSIPLLYVSSVTGAGMDDLAQFLNALEKPTTAAANVESEEEEDDGAPSTERGVMGIIRTYLLSTTDMTSSRDGFFAKVEGEIDETADDQMESLFGGGDDSFLSSPSPKSNEDENEKLVVVGVVRSGEFRLNQTLFVGPDQDNGTFARAVVISMRCVTSASVSIASQGTTVSLCLKFLDCNDGRAFARRGALVCADPAQLEKMLLRKVEVVISSNGVEGNLKKNEEVILLNGVVKQSTRVQDVFGNRVTLQFVYRSEYVLEENLFLRKTSGVLVGKVVSEEAKNES